MSARTLVMFTAGVGLTATACALFQMVLIGPRFGSWMVLIVGCMYIVSAVYMFRKVRNGKG